MTRREFVQLGTWALIAAALGVKADGATGLQGNDPTTARPRGWGVPWRINWQIGAEKPEPVYLPVVKS